MLQKKRKELVKFSPLQEKNITEILVTNGRSFEPFLRTFCTKGENVAKSHLGTLVGVFEVGERTEDSAYIVNFLASVAKKEYFAQGRRGPIESFEAALHKINIALAELVKHGNVEWLGKLHGVLGVIEKNNLHFSAAGEGKLLLLRKGAFTEISEGLASDEAALHPMKTFVEVASGRLEAEDKLLFASPEIFRLFSMEELGKNAVRLEERFPQFLKTALVNELDMAGIIYLSFSEAPPLSHPETLHSPQKKETASPVANVFSGQAFTPPREKPPVSLPLLEPETATSEYIDTKTGHIYIQGESPKETSAHPFWEKFGLQLEELRTHFQNTLGSQRRFFRKIRKQGIIALAVAAGHGQAAARRLWRGIRRRLSQRRLAPPPEATFSAVPSAPAGRETRVIENAREETSSPAQGLSQVWPLPSEPLRERLDSQVLQEPSAADPDFERRLVKLPLEAPTSPLGWSARSARFGKIIFSFLQARARELLTFFCRSFHLCSRNLRMSYLKLPKRSRLFVMLGGLAFFGLMFSGIWFFGKIASERASDDSDSSANAPFLSASIIPAEELHAATAGTSTLLAEQNEDIVEPLFLGNSLFLVTKGGIVQVSENTFYPLPPNTGAVLLAASMEDLRLLFIATENGGVFSFSPITRAYTQSTLALPEKAVLSGMEAYLTYLYALDSATNQIYRFPRAAGGFGTPAPWLREPVAIEEGASMAVHESIFLASKHTVLESYFQGRKTRTLEAPVLPLEVEAVFTKPGINRVYALDRENKRILVWNTEGTLEKQFFSEEFADARAFAINEEGTKAFVSTEHKLFSVPLPGNTP